MNPIKILHPSHSPSGGTVSAFQAKGANLFCEPQRASRKFFDAEIFAIHKEYMESPNLSLLDICQKYSIAQQNIRKRFIKLQLPTKPLRVVCHRLVNDAFFSKIDSEIKGYLLGFFAADGHIEKRDYGYCLKFNVHKKDKEVLELYRRYVANNLVEVREYNSRPTMCSISIHSQEIGNDLKRLGYDNRKTYTSSSLPNIPSAQMRHFIRGFIDGDGSVYFGKATRGYNRYLDISSNSSELLESLIGHLPAIKGNIRRTFKTNISLIINGRIAHFKQIAKIRISDKSSLQIIYNYLYADSNYYLQRKFNIFNQIIQ